MLQDFRIKIKMLTATKITTVAAATITAVKSAEIRSY